MNKSLKLLIAVLTLTTATAVAPFAGAQTTSRPMSARPMAPPAENRPVPASANSAVPGKMTPAGERFFIVASLDLQKSQLLLKYPTEVTLLAKTTDQTKFVDESGKPIKLSDLRTGDTVWVTSTGSADSTIASKVRKGQMTVADLHRYYLDYPAIK